MPKGKSSEEGGGAPVSFATPADRSSRSRLLDHHLCETCTSTQREPAHYLYLYLYLYLKWGGDAALVLGDERWEGA